MTKTEEVMLKIQIKKHLKEATKAIHEARRVLVYDYGDTINEEHHNDYKSPELARVGELDSKLDMIENNLYAQTFVVDKLGEKKDERGAA